MTDNSIQYEVEESDIESVDSTDAFLEELGRDQYIPKPSKAVMQKEEKAQAKALKKMQMDQEREAKRHAKEAMRQETARLKEAKKCAKSKSKSEDNDNDSLFGGEPTEIMGKDKILLLRKAKQYKTLFPSELKTFKLKKNPSVKDLADAVQEMEIMVETGGVNEFLEDSVIQCIKVLENVSAVSPRYDVRGMSLMLQHNPQFKKLSKILFVKYNINQNIPPEFQMLMLVGTSAMLANNKNRGKDKINAYLNGTI
jgi:hypothetical protein